MIHCKTSNDIIAGNGRERFMIELIFIVKKLTNRPSSMSLASPVFRFKLKIILCHTKI